MRARSIVLAAVLAASFVFPGAAPTEAARCRIVWGSLEKVAPDMSGAPIINVRAGRHACFDRIVVDANGPAPGYAVRYLPEVTTIASGEPVPLRGGAFLEFIVRSPAHDENYISTYPSAGSSELVNVRGFRTLRQLAWGGTQEGLTEIAVGVRARLPFRVFVLPGPGTQSRVVLDIAHRW